MHPAYKYKRELTTKSGILRYALLAGARPFMAKTDAPYPKLLIGVTEQAELCRSRW